MSCSIHYLKKILVPKKFGYKKNLGQKNLGQNKIIYSMYCISWLNFALSRPTIFSGTKRPNIFSSPQNVSGLLFALLYVLSSEHYDTPLIPPPPLWRVFRKCFFCQSKNVPSEMFQQQAVFTNMFPSICLSEGAKHIIHTLQVFLFDFALHFQLTSWAVIMYLSIPPTPP